jgi:hypothetical protein
MPSTKILSKREGYSTWKFKMRMHEKLWYAVTGSPVSDKIDDAMVIRFLIKWMMQ